MDETYIDKEYQGHAHGRLGEGGGGYRGAELLFFNIRRPLIFLDNKCYIACQSSLVSDSLYKNWHFGHSVYLKGE